MQTASICTWWRGWRCHSHGRGCDWSCARGCSSGRRTCAWRRRCGCGTSTQKWRLKLIRPKVNKNSEIWGPFVRNQAWIENCCSLDCWQKLCCKCMPSYISVPALVALGACHSNQILEGVVPVTNGPEFAAFRLGKNAAFISSKHNWGGYMNAITIICTCIGEEDKQQAKSCRDRHMDTGCWRLNDSTDEPCMEVTADLPWSRHKRMDSWMVSQCHWFWNKSPIHIKRHGKPRRCRACFVQVISPNKNNKKEHTKHNTMHRWMPPSLGGKASESDDPTSSPTKKTEVESHRIPMSCLIRRGFQAMNAMKWCVT